MNTQNDINQVVGIKSGIDGSIYFCVHCGFMAKGKSRYCNSCSTKEGRVKQCTENNEYFLEALKKPYICKEKCL